MGTAFEKRETKWADTPAALHCPTESTKCNRGTDLTIFDTVRTPPPRHTPRSMALLGTAKGQKHL